MRPAHSLLPCVSLMLPSAGHYAYANLPATAYWKILKSKLFSGKQHRESEYLHGHKSVSTLSKLSTPRADSPPHIPLGSECSSSGASPSYAADGNKIWFCWRSPIKSKSKHYPFMQKTALYSMMINFLHFYGEKYPFLYKLLTITGNVCPYFTKSKLVSWNFFS